MKAKKLGFIILLAMGLLWLAACGPNPDPTPTPEPSPPAASTEQALEMTPPPVRVLSLFGTAVPDDEVLGPDPGGDFADAYRVIFLLDNSKTPVTKCPAAADAGAEKTPQNSAARRTMRDITVFLTDLLAAVNGGAGRPELQIGVYQAYHESEAPDSATPDPGDLRPWTVLPLQPAAGFERDFAWVTALDNALSEPAVNVGGYGPMVRRLIKNDVLVTDKGARQIVVFMTDGYTGDYPDFDADLMRDDFEVVLRQLALQKNTTFHFLQFECPGLADNKSYEEDKRYWTSFAGLYWLVYRTLPLSEAPALGVNVLSHRPHAETVVDLLSDPSFAPLLPAPPAPNGASGWGWLPEGQVMGDVLQLPGDTGALRLNVVRSDEYSTFKVVLARDDETYSPPELKEGSFPGTFAAADEDNLLEDILAAPTRACGAIEWWLEGDSRLAFYWWDSNRLAYELDETTIGEGTADDATTLNHAPIEVNVRVTADGRKGYRDCYSARVTLHTDEEPPRVVARHDMPLVRFNDFLEQSITLEGYEFLPEHADTGFWVTVELLRHTGAPVGGGAAAEDNRRVALWESEVTPTYRPRLLVEESAADCDDETCAAKIVLDFAAAVHHAGDAPPVELFALSALPRDTINDKEACAAHFTASSDGVLSISDKSDRGLVSGFRIADVSKHADDPTVDDNDDEPGGRRIVTTEFSRSANDPCGYEALLLQWPDQPSWPGVFCALDGSNCLEMSVEQMSATVMDDTPVNTLDE